MHNLEPCVMIVINLLPWRAHLHIDTVTRLLRPCSHVYILMFPLNRYVYPNRPMTPNAPREKAVVVVDPYSSGRYLLYELKERGLNIICVRSSLNLDPYFINAYYAHKDYYCATVDYTTTHASAKALKELNYEVHLASVLSSGHVIQHIF